MVMVVLVVFIMVMMCSCEVWFSTALAYSMSMVWGCIVWLVVMGMSYMDVNVVSMRH